MIYPDISRMRLTTIYLYSLYCCTNYLSIESIDDIYQRWYHMVPEIIISRLLWSMMNNVDGNQPNTRLTNRLKKESVKKEDSPDPSYHMEATNSKPTILFTEKNCTVDRIAIRIAIWIFSLHDNAIHAYPYISILIIIYIYLIMFIYHHYDLLAHVSWCFPTLWPPWPTTSRAGSRSACAS